MCKRDTVFSILCPLSGDKSIRADDAIELPYQHFEILRWFACIQLLWKSFMRYGLSVNVFFFSNDISLCVQSLGSWFVCNE